MGAQRPTKRRRVNEPTLQPLKTQAVSPDLPNQVAFVCSTCGRGFRLPKGLQTLCSRCTLPTCTICTRTCTASRSSVPPTPSLTRSPTPESTPFQSPKRVALSLQSNNTNIPEAIKLASENTPHPGKRRKHEDEGLDSKDALEHALCEYALGPGCGRVICKKCCVEDMRSETVICNDCQYGPLTLP